VSTIYKPGDCVATRDAYGTVLCELGAENRDVVALDADLSASTKSCEFARRFPDRFFNCGIAEQNMIGIAAGLAAAGKTPFASTFAVFASGRVFDQLRVAVAYPNLNVKIGASHGGVTVGEDGASHQALEDIALMRVLPNMTVLVPADAVATRALVRAAAAHRGPVYIRLGRPAVPVLYEDEDRCRIGRAALLRDGSDVAIIACGYMVALALEAARELAASGIAAAVLDASSVKPLDEPAVVAAARRCHAVVTAEEHSVIGGLGGAVAELLGERLPVPVIRVGTRDRFGESGSPAELVAALGLGVPDIVRACGTAMAARDSGT
jgi:transketolase